MTDHPMTRRAMLGGSALAAAAGTLGALAPAAHASLQATPAAAGSTGQTQVYLLGAQSGQTRNSETGSGLHAGTSVLLMVNGAGYLMDAGVGWTTTKVTSTTEHGRVRYCILFAPGVHVETAPLGHEEENRFLTTLGHIDSIPLTRPVRAEIDEHGTVKVG
jgi:hypothetical protein